MDYQIFKACCEMIFNDRFILFKFDVISSNVIDKQSKKKISYKLLLNIIKQKFFSITNIHSIKTDQIDIIEYEQEFLFNKTEVISLLKMINDIIRNDFLCFICDKGKLTMSLSEHVIVCSFCQSMIPNIDINQLRNEILNLQRDHSTNCNSEPFFTHSAYHGIIRALDYICQTCLTSVSIINANKL